MGSYSGNLVCGGWKLIHYCEAQDQLFNLAEDPNELTNLHAVRSEIVSELYRDLLAICSPEKENELAHRREANQLEVIARDFADPPHTG